MAAAGELSVWILPTIVSLWIVAHVAATSVCDLTGPTLAALTYTNNTVTSPNYPLNYDQNEDCSLTLKANQRFHVVKVVFKDFLLGMGTSGDCNYDKLEFYDGVSEFDTKIGTFCGETHPEVLYSSGRHLYVRFTSDGSSEFQGFSFYFSAVPADEAAGICRPGAGDIRVKRSSGTIFTPNYPVPFKTGVQCVWIITVPAGKRVKLIFDAFQLSSDSSCYGSKVVIKDGELSFDLVRGTYCGSSLPPTVSSGLGENSLRVEFSAGYGNESYSGFKAHFQASDDISLNSYSKCHPGNSYNDDLKLEGSSGTLESPLYPSSYPPDITCTWVITVPHGKIVKLTFKSFDVDYEYSYCSGDYVEVKDGQFAASKLIGEYCGGSKPDDIRSSGRYLRVHFRSDSESYILNEGFEAKFQAVDKSNGLIVGIVVAGVVFVCLIVCVVCIVKRNRGRNTRRRQPVTVATAAPDTTAMIGMQQPPPPPPSVGYAPVQAPAIVPYPPEMYPKQDPPPYPGLEGAPQYPPPGQQYPWYQDSQKGGTQPSAPPASP